VNDCWGGAWGDAWGGSWGAADSAAPAQPPRRGGRSHLIGDSTTLEDRIIAQNNTFITLLASLAAAGAFE
jgi:hypothetical protein